MDFSLEGLRIHMNEFSNKGNVSDEDFMIHILSNLPNEYDMIHDGFENRLTATGDDAVTIDSIREIFFQETLLHQYVTCSTHHSTKERFFASRTKGRYNVPCMYFNKHFSFLQSSLSGCLTWVHINATAV